MYNMYHSLCYQFHHRTRKEPPWLQSHVFKSQTDRSEHEIKLIKRASVRINILYNYISNKGPLQIVKRDRMESRAFSY